MQTLVLSAGSSIVLLALGAPLGLELRVVAKARVGVELEALLLLRLCFILGNF